MHVSRNANGLNYIRFTDRTDRPCIIGESSLASEASLRFGHEKGGCAHLTQGMVRRLVAALHDRRDTTFVDRDDQSIELISHDDRMLVLVDPADGGDQIQFDLENETIHGLLPFIARFAVSGSLVGEDVSIEEALETRAPRVLDLKIAPSMLDRADVGETGVSAQALIDALCVLTEGRDLGDIAESIGYDAADRIVALRDAVRPHWRNSDGSHAVLR